MSALPHATEGVFFVGVVTVTVGSKEQRLPDLPIILGSYVKLLPALGVSNSSPTRMSTTSSETMTSLQRCRTFWLLKKRHYSLNYLKKMIFFHEYQTMLMASFLPMQNVNNGKLR